MTSYCKSIVGTFSGWVTATVSRMPINRLTTWGEEGGQERRRLKYDSGTWFKYFVFLVLEFLSRRCQQVSNCWIMDEMGKITANRLSQLSVEVALSSCGNAVVKRNHSGALQLSSIDDRHRETESAWYNVSLKNTLHKTKNDTWWHELKYHVL